MPEKTQEEQAKVFVGRKRSQGQMSLGQQFAEQRYTEDLALNKEDDRRKGKRDFTVQQTQVEFSRRGKLKITLYPRKVADAKMSSHFTGKGGPAVHVDPKAYVPPAPKPVPAVHPAKDKSPASACKPYQGETAEELKKWGDETKGTWAFQKPVRKSSGAPRDFARYIKDRSAIRMYAAMESLKAAKEWKDAGGRKWDFKEPEHCKNMRASVDTYESWKQFREADGVVLRRWVSAGKCIARARLPVFKAKLQEPGTRITGVVSPKETARKFAATVAKEGTPAYKKAFHAKFTELNAKRRSRDVSDEVKQRFESRR